MNLAEIKNRIIALEGELRLLKKAIIKSDKKPKKPRNKDLEAFRRFADQDILNTLSRPKRKRIIK